MAVDNWHINQTYTAGADLSSAQFKLVEQSTAGVVSLCSLGDRAVGVAQEDSSCGGTLSVCVLGFSKVITDGALAASDLVASSTVGLAQASTANAKILGRISEGSTGQSGDVLTMWFQQMST